MREAQDPPAEPTQSGLPPSQSTGPQQVHDRNSQLRRRYRDHSIDEEDDSKPGQDPADIEPTRKFRKRAASMHPSLLFRQSSFVMRVYYVNHHWKSVIVKLVLVIYMTIIGWSILKECDPWYEFFFYLTLQGWLLELIYFSYSLYLDLLARCYGGGEYLSLVAKAAAQALSEVCFALQVVIFSFFWIVVYPQETWRSVWWELNCHGVGLVLIIGDYLYRFTGFSLKNHKYVLGFAGCYTTLYAFVVLYLGKSIYPGMDLRSLKSIVIFLAGLSTVVFTHKVVYLISNWRWIKEDMKSLIGISKVILVRQNSVDMFRHGLTDFGSELLSLSPKAVRRPVRAASLSPRSSSRTRQDSLQRISQKDLL